MVPCFEKLALCERCQGLQLPDVLSFQLSQSQGTLLDTNDLCRLQRGKVRIFAACKSAQDVNMLSCDACQSHAVVSFPCCCICFCCSRCSLDTHQGSELFCAAADAVTNTACAVLCRCCRCIMLLMLLLLLLLLLLWLLPFLQEMTQAQMFNLISTMSV